LFISAWSDVYARIRALHSLDPSTWDPISASGKVKLSSVFPDPGDFVSPAAAEAWRVKHLRELEAAYKMLLEGCGQRPVLFVHVIQGQTEGVTGACVRLFLHVYNKVVMKAESRDSDSGTSSGCFCMRRFTGREITANEYDCHGSDFIILPGSASNATSTPSHPVFHTSMLLPFASLDDKITFDLHNNHCCVPWSWQAVNHVTAFASKQLTVSKLVQKQVDSREIIKDPKAAAEAAIKGLQVGGAVDVGAVASGGGGGASDSLNSWGNGLVEYQWMKCKDITRMTKGQVLIGSCILPPKDIRDRAESLQKTHGLPFDSLGVIESLVGHLVITEIGASAACPNVLRVMSTVASWLGCSNAAPLCMLLDALAAHVINNDITACQALSHMCKLLDETPFDVSETSPLPIREQQLVNGMWNRVCLMFESLTHQHLGIECSLFYSSDAVSAPASHGSTWLEHVVQLIQFYESMSVLILNSPQHTLVAPSDVSGVAASCHPVPAGSDVTPAAARVLNYLKHCLVTFVEELKERLFDSAHEFSHSLGDRSIKISKQTCFACCYCDSLASVLDQNLALSLHRISKSFPHLVTCIHNWAVIIIQKAANAAHPPHTVKSEAFVDAEYSFPWFVTSFGRMISFFRHSAFKSDAFSGKKELIDILGDIENRTVASARVWIEKYIHSTMIENVRTNTGSDDWTDNGTGNSLGVVLLINEVCAHVTNFAESLSKMGASESVNLSLCERLVEVMFSVLRQYSKQLLPRLRDALHKNASAITGRASPVGEEAGNVSKGSPHMLEEVITSEVIVMLHNFLYLRNHLDYIMDQIALACLRHASRQPFIDAHQATLAAVQAKLRHQLSSALLMVTDATARFCLEPACAAALMDAGDTDDRGELGDQESAVGEFNQVLVAVKDFLQQAAGSLDSAQGRQLKSLLGNSLQRAAVSFLEDSVFSKSFEPKTTAGDTDALRRMCSLVLRSGNAEFLSREQLPALLDGSDDLRLQGEFISLSRPWSLIVCAFYCLCMLCK
jgi:hypothetical protein